MSLAEKNVFKDVNILAALIVTLPITATISPVGSGIASIVLWTRSIKSVIISLSIFSMFSQVSSDGFNKKASIAISAFFEVSCSS